MKKIIISIIVATILLMASVLAWSSDLSDATLVGVTDTSTWVTETRALGVSPDGLYLYSTNSANGVRVSVFDVPFDISLVTRDSYLTQLETGCGFTTLEDISFSSDGMYLYIVCGSLIEQYSLSNPYIVEYTSPLVNTYSFSTVSNLKTVLFNGDGTVLYTGTTSSKYYMHTLTIPYNISSIVESNTAYSLGFNSAQFNDDGTKLYANYYSNVNEYNLSIPYSPQSAVLENTLIVNGWDFFIAGEGENLYIITNSADAISQYEVGTYNTEPIINSLTPIDIDFLDNEAQIFTLDLTDTDGDATIVWDVDGSYVGACDNSSTCEISGGDYSVALHTLTTTISDAEFSSTTNVNFEIIASNTEPVINSITPSDRVELTNGNSQIYTSDVTDEDGDAIYNWTLGGIVVSSTSTYTANWEDIEPGIYTLQLEVSDAEYSNTMSTTLEIRAQGGEGSSFSIVSTANIDTNIADEVPVVKIAPEEKESATLLGGIGNFFNGIGDFFKRLF